MRIRLVEVGDVSQAWCPQTFWEQPGPHHAKTISHESFMGFPKNIFGENSNYSRAVQKTVMSCIKPAGTLLYWLTGDWILCIHACTDEKLCSLFFSWLDCHHFTRILKWHKDMSTFSNKSDKVIRHWTKDWTDRQTEAQKTTAKSPLWNILLDIPYSHRWQPHLSPWMTDKLARFSKTSFHKLHLPFTTTNYIYKYNKDNHLKHLKYWNTHYIWAGFRVDAI